MLFINFIKKLLKYSFKIFCQIYKLPNKSTVVVYMDGGLCSQMYEYAVGEYFRENGFVVKYDISWFKKCGRDVFGRDARFFEIKKLYPKLKIRIASQICIELFRRECRTEECDIVKCVESKKNLYLINDKPLIIPIEKVNDIKKKLFTNPFPPRDRKNKFVANMIASDKKSCAVHVRRGDLSDPDIAQKSGYGKCVTTAYYEKTISLMSSLITNIKFYFFSDDLEYVKSSIVPLIKNHNYCIVDINKDTVLNGGGYKDFYLIYLCKNHICSIGSFGMEAARLNSNSEKIVITTKNEIKDFKNIIVLDTDGNLITSTIPIGE